jgi:tetratricopeptide (TPR) repeat protein
MRPRAILGVLVLLLIAAWPSRAVANPIDSLKTLIANAEHDTVRCKLTIQIGTAFFNSNLDSAFAYWQQALKMGESLAESDDPVISKFGKRQVMRSASNTAVVYQYRGLYPLALKLYQRCLRIAEELKDRRGTMMAYNNIGLIKMGQEKHDEALDYFERSHAISLELNDSMTSSTTINNVGAALKRLKRNDEALSKFRESLVWAKRVGNDDQIVDDLINIGSIQIINHHFDSAYATFRQSLTLAGDIGYSLGKPSILSGISAAYAGSNRLDSALHFAQAGLDTARALDMTEEILGGLEQLAEIQKRLGKFELAVRTMEEYIQLKDSFFSTSKTLEFGQLEQSFEYERQEFEEALKEQARAAELRAKNFRQYLISFTTACVIALLLLFGVRYARNRRLRYFVVFGALLFFFEFALVLLDSFVDSYTGGLPIPKLMANVLLAAALAPLNIVLEKSLMRRRAKSVVAAQAEARGDGD